jgi:hypothetical protein
MPRAALAHSCSGNQSIPRGGGLLQGGARQAVNEEHTQTGGLLTARVWLFGSAAGVYGTVSRPDPVDPRSPSLLRINVSSSASLDAPSNGLARTWMLS